ncbi:MAG: EpsG family protein [Bacteroidales bacterium]|nr:EpsG family protein [Bacteroidales bacterium]
MIYIILLLLLYFSFAFPKSKLIHIFLLTIIFALFSLSFDDYDFHNYMAIFEYVNSEGTSSFEPLFTLFARIIGSWGLNFIQFRYITTLFFIILFDSFIIKTSTKPNIILALYIIFSAMYDAPLMRHLLAMCISFWGCYYLMLSGSYTTYIKPAVLFSIASLFHGSYWICLFFIPIWYLLTQGKNKLVSLLLIVLLFICIFGSHILFDVYSNFISKESALEEYNNNNFLNFIGVVYFILKYIVVVSPVLILKPCNYSFTDINNPIRVINYNIVKLNIVFLIVLILQYIAPGYTRLLRILIVFNYIYIISYPKGRISKKYGLAILYAMTLLLLTALWEMPESIETIIQMHFDTNLLFSLFKI